MAIEEDTESRGAESGSARSGFRLSFIFAGAGGALLLVLLVLVLTSNGTAPKPPPSNHQAPGSAAPAPAPDEGSTEIPQSAPVGVSWQLYHTVALPVSQQAGPRAISDSTATRYAHTPTGALLAGAQIQYRQLLAPNWQQVVDQQLMPGPGRDAFAQARGQLGPMQPAPGELAQLAGFKVINYTPQIATIQYVSRTVAGALSMTTSTLQWDGGDWKVALQPGASSAQPLQTMAGFIPWGGV